MNVTPHAHWLKTYLPTWLYKLASQAWIDYEYPRHLFIETTAACNLACPYCPRESLQAHMAWQTFTAIVDEASRYGPRSFSLHLFGEPLLYPRCMDAIRYIKSKNRRHVVLLTTNGTLLDRLCDRLLAAPPDLILWSWRPEATFSQATKAKLKRWGKFRVRFIQEVTPPEAYEEWKEWPNVEGRPLHNYGGNIDIKKCGTSTKTANSSGSRDTATRWPCYHLWLAPAAAWNGDLLMCCADPHHKEVLGHFPEMSIHQMWVSDWLKEIRQSHLKGKYMGICSHCDVWKQYPNLFFPWQKAHSIK